jgi:hypothetical protein
MRGHKTLLHVVSIAEERDQLEQRLRCTTTSLGLALRCRAILGVTGGRPLVEVVRWGLPGNGRRTSGGRCRSRTAPSSPTNWSATAC